MERSKRRTLKKVITLAGVLAAGGVTRASNTMKDAMEQDAREVERLYSTKPIRVRLGASEYVIPVNYFTEKGHDRADVLELTDGSAFGFVLFLPDFSGFTTQNWQKGWFDTNRIEVIELRPVDKNALVPLADGGYEKVQPANYGEPKAQFANIKSLFEDTPSVSAYDLDGFRPRNRERGMMWVGHRWNGEFFFFLSTDTPGEPLPPGVVHPLCRVRYYTPAEDLLISYFYPQQHIARWKEIDQAIWTKIRGWQVK